MKKNLWALRLFPSKPLSILLPFLLAFISIVYEFTLAQIITLFHGNTFTVYSITIGLYTFALGFGALFFESIKNKASLETLFKVELLLSLTALTSPFLIVFASSPMLRGFSEPLMYFLVFFPVLACGFLSGLELPSLLMLNPKKKGAVLLWDYVGMFLGALIFGAYALERFGPMKLMWVMALINCLALIALLRQASLSFSTFRVLSISLLFFSCLVLIYNEELIYSSFRVAYGF